MLVYEFFVIKSDNSHQISLNIKFGQLINSKINKQQMDYEDIIKMEEQSPLYSTGNNNSTSIKNCMASFYDQDSEFDRRDYNDSNHHYEQLSFDKAIDYAQNYINIIDTPVQDVLNYIDRLQCADGLDKSVLRIKILKRKNQLKRYRAKNRQPKIIAYEPESPTIVSPKPIDTEVEIKKKRNRVSAQISRDRKKQYFKELQQKNQKLQQQIYKTKLENQKLKTILDTATKTKKKFFSDTLNNKLMRLLIFLGIICLIGMLKETFCSASENFSKFKMTSKLDEINNFAFSHQKNMIEEGQRKVAQFLEEPELQQEFVDTEERKVEFKIDSPPIGKKRNMFLGLISRLTDMKEVMGMKNVEL